VAEYTLNRRAVTYARNLIDGHHYVLDSDCGEKQPDSEAQNRYLKSHSSTPSAA